MEYCKTCGYRLRGHNTSVAKPPTEIIKNGKTLLTIDLSNPIYTWECLNKDCPQFEKLLTDVKIGDEIIYLIQQLNLIKKTLGMNGDAKPTG